MLPIFNVPTVHNSYLFCISLPRIIILCLFTDSHSDRYQAVSQRGFDCINDIEYLFMCPQTIYIYILCGKNVYLGPLPILKLYFLVLLILSCVSSDSKESVCNVGDPDLIPGSERSLEKGNDNCFSLGKTMDRGAWRATIHRVAKRRTQLSY